MYEFSKPDVSVWEAYCTRITLCAWTYTQAYETFGRKEQGIEDLQAPVSCFACPCWERNCFLLLLLFYVLRSYDVVLWDTVMCTSLCRQAVWRSVGHCSVCSSLSLSSCLPRSFELRTQKLKSHLVRTQGLNFLPLEPAVRQCIAIYATLTARDFFCAYFYPSGPFTCIFSKPLPIFPVLAVANTWFQCRPAE